MHTWLHAYGGQIRTAAALPPPNLRENMTDLDMSAARFSAAGNVHFGSCVSGRSLRLLAVLRS
jgi:hypothetical protein